MDLSPFLRALKPHVVCQIAGMPTLLPPPSIDLSRAGKLSSPNTRIPRALLTELSTHDNIPAELRTRLKGLSEEYKTLTRRRRNNDDSEHAHLDSFGRWMLRKTGLRGQTFDVPGMIRRLEQGGWGGSRDHFFHSFQNFFFGLYAVSQLSDSFVGCQTVTKLNWDVDPFQVWFLTALWHDVGYGIQNFQNVTEDLWGRGSAEDIDIFARSQFLSESQVIEGLRVISSLMTRLLTPDDAVSTWMPPNDNSRLSAVEKQILESLKDDVATGGHGAASALRMYSDLIPKVNRMTSAKRDKVRQTILLACSSMPFHDWRFRACLRQNMGTCLMPVHSMPFAGMLAFVDSIQDDRRNISGLRSEVLFLERLLVRTQTVSAKVNPAALSPADVLWKVVESRDVLSSMSQHDGSINFRYPDWMAG